MGIIELSRIETTESTASARPVPVLGWGVAVPGFEFEQDALAERFAVGREVRFGRLVRAAFRGAGVDRRASCVPDFSDVCRAPRLFRGVSPTTAERMAVFAEEAPALACVAAARALAASGVDHARVTHLFVVSCTGFAAPGVDADLIDELDLPRDVRRILFGYQGCAAGLAALRAAAETARGEPSAVILVVAVELSSLHFRVDLDLEDVRGHALFADGAGAAVIAGNPRGVAKEAATRENFASDRREAAGSPRIFLEQGASIFIPGTRDAMTWTITDHGFAMRLAPDVPERLAAEIPAFVSRLARGPGAFRDFVWAVHPGGPAILDRLAAAAGLGPAHLDGARAVLRRHGNMSSATIFFVFEELLRRAGAEGFVARGDASGGRQGVALAFGPGLHAEGLAFRGYVPEGNV